MKTRQLLVDLILTNLGLLALMYLLSSCSNNPSKEVYFQAFHTGCIEGLEAGYMVCTGQGAIPVQLTNIFSESCRERFIEKYH